MKRIMNFWFSTGTPTMLVNVMRRNYISHDRRTIDGYKVVQVK